MTPFNTSSSAPKAFALPRPSATVSSQVQGLSAVCKANAPVLKLPNFPREISKRLQLHIQAVRDPLDRPKPHPVRPRQPRHRRRLHIHRQRPVRRKQPQLLLQARNRPVVASTTGVRSPSAPTTQTSPRSSHPPPHRPPAPIPPSPPATHPPAIPTDISVSTPPTPSAASTAIATRSRPIPAATTTAVGSRYR